MEEFKPRYSKEEISPERAYEIAEESLKNIQEIVKEELKSGRKPDISKNIKDIINRAIDNVINQPEENILIGVLPQYREETRSFLLQALEYLAKELKRQNLLDTSIFTDETKLSLLAEMLIINREEIKFIITNESQLQQSIIEQSIIEEKKQSIIKKANHIATYHNYKFIKDFINRDELISKELNITPQEAQELFSKWLRLRFAAYNISNPLEALKRVKQHLDTILTDENIAQQLNITPQEAQELFSKSLRLYFAVGNISNPLETLQRVKEHLDTTLTDENIAQQLNITTQEAQELFPKSLRFHFAVHNISNPLEALKRVKQHLDNILTDENIAQQLNITPQEAQELFSKSLRLYFAVYNISNPLEVFENWLEGKTSTPYDYKRNEILKRLKKEKQ